MARQFTGKSLYQAAYTAGSVTAQIKEPQHGWARRPAWLLRAATLVVATLRSCTA
jgi:hypothetical protein